MEPNEVGAIQGVVDFRLIQLETEIGKVSAKLDRFIDSYPSKELLELILKPYREDIEELKKKNEDKEKQSIEQRQQLKYITYAAVISPLASIIVAALVTLLLMGVSNK